MQASYRKDSEHNYLLFGDIEIDQSEYVYQMFLHNPLDQLLPSDITMRDGKASLRFDITACTSVARRFDTVALSGTDLRRILFAIRETALHLSDLLLDARDLILEPEFVFLGPGQDQIFLCYIPHLSDSSPDTVRTLSEFFLKKTDHNDPAAASLAYAFYDAVSGENYVLLDLLETLLLPNPAADPAADSAADPDYGFGPERTQFDQKIRAADSVSQLSDVYASYDPADRKKLKSGGGKSPEYANASGSILSGTSRADQSSQKKTGKKGRKTSVKRKTGVQNDSRKRKRRKRRLFLSLLLPAILVLGTAAVLILIFHPDLTQIGGAGFLSAAVIWMIHNTIERHSGEIHNVWADEDFDTEDDDIFYQNLLKEAYAQPESSRQTFSPDDKSPNPDSTGWENIDRVSAGQSNTSWKKVGRVSADQSNTSWKKAGRVSAGQSNTAWKKAGRDSLNRGKATDSPSVEATRYLSGQAAYSSSSSAAALISLRPDSYPDISLNRDHLLIGKSPEKADIILPSDTVSRVHARIEKRSDGLYVTDLFSTNGTFLDGHRLEPNRSARLLDSARLTIAGYNYRVQIPGTDEAKAAYSSRAAY